MPNNMCPKTFPQALRRAALALALAWFAAWALPAIASDAVPRVAILVYHRFGLTAADSMTVRVETFEAQLSMLRAHGYRFVALRDVLDWLDGERASLPPKAIALTVDDGHRSVFDTLQPIALRERLPITLFIYPSAISNASYALTWDQLQALQTTGSFDVQSHTFWHPNFNTERARLSHDAFEAFATMQLRKSRASLETHLGTHVDVLAWPFGIVDDELVRMASAAGYRAAFELGGRMIDRDAPRFRLPRFLVVDSDTPAVLARLLGEPVQADLDVHLPENQP